MNAWLAGAARHFLSNLLSKDVIDSFVPLGLQVPPATFG